MLLVGSVGVHDEDLVALQITAGGLEDKALAVGRPIGFGILAAVGQLPDVPDGISVRQWQHGRDC
jgi:hypothetical protein